MKFLRHVILSIERSYYASVEILLEGRKPHRAITAVLPLVMPFVPLSDSFVSKPCLVRKSPLADQCLSTYHVGLQERRDAISCITGKSKINN